MEMLIEKQGRSAQGVGILEVDILEMRKFQATLPAGIPPRMGSCLVTLVTVGWLGGHFGTSVHDCLAQATATEAVANEASRAG